MRRRRIPFFPRAWFYFFKRTNGAQWWEDEIRSKPPGLKTAAAGGDQIQTTGSEDSGRAAARRPVASRAATPLAESDVADAAAHVGLQRSRLYLCNPTPRRNLPKPSATSKICPPFRSASSSLTTHGAHRIEIAAASLTDRRPGMGSTGSNAEVTRADFPDGFVFGVATSAYQIEGARREGGKGDSIWDVFADNKEHILDETTGEVAVDHYHRYKEDIELMAKLGFGAYRFSISWSRIFPDGLGKNINEQGVAFYNDLINFMIEKGIEPYATLYHWDLPHNLQQTVGGWLSDKIVEYFALYAEACFANFGDRVKHWITINEPLQTAVNGYGIGIFAPGVCEGAAAEPFLAAHHQILAHAAAVDVYRRKFKAVQGGEVGFVIDCEWAEPFSDKTEDQDAAARRIDFQLGWYLDPIYFGDYPESMRQRLGDHLPKFSEKDRELIRNKIDFIGLNHYTTRFIAHQQDPKDIHFYRVQQMERLEKWNTGEGIGERAASEWLFIVPWGLRKVLNYIAKKYENPVIYVTENGMDDEDDQSARLDQVLNDTKRVGYFKGYVGAVAQAIKDGADVRGYFAWSFLDNFEWAMGYTKRFGLVYVDYKDGLSRHPKASAMWFSRFLKGNAADSKSDIN